MGNVNWIQILFIVLVFGGGAIQWVMRKLAEQRAVRQAKLERERAELERLRTGRVDEPAAEAAPTKPDLDTIAARRQRQLEELRRRQQAARRPAPATPRQTPAGGSPATRQRPGQSVPTARQRPLPSAGPAPIEAGEIDSGTTEHHSTIKAPRQTRSPEFKGRADGFAAGEHDPQKVSELAARFEQQARKKPKGPAVIISDDVPRSAAEWRKAIIASEILAKPLSERPSES